MMIHKAKGLEFPVVFVIGFVDGVLPNSMGDIEEERRIAFVGISRAMKLLYLSYSSKHMGKAAKVSPFLEEIPVEINIAEIDPPEAKNLKEPIELKGTLTDLDIQKYRELLRRPLVRPE